MNTLPKLNIILLGRTGAGKSASANTILGRKRFVSKKSFKRVTSEIQQENVTVDGISLTVYDTPGLSYTETSNKEVLAKCQSDLHLDESVPSVFLLVIQADRFGPEERKVVEEIEEFLGETRSKNTWILFTRGDELEEEQLTVEGFIEDTDNLKRVVKRFENRFHLFNNKTENIDQVSKLVGKIKSTTLQRRSTEETRSIPSNSLPERKILLLGKTGVGKSATGNTILGEKRFHSERSSSSLTKKSEIQQSHVFGRKVFVTDTPGFFDTSFKQEDVITELGTSIYLSSPGIHAFLIVLPLNGHFTQQEEQVIKLARDVFGEKSLEYTLILFTHGDQLEGKTIEKFIEENKALRSLVQRCGQRYHVFNNKDNRNRDQVTELLQKIDGMVRKNGGPYTNELFEKAKKFKKEKVDTGLWSFLMATWEQLKQKAACAIAGLITGVSGGAAIGGPIGAGVGGALGLAAGSVADLARNRRQAVTEGQSTEFARNCP